jgi:hypothetical protein
MKMNSGSGYYGIGIKEDLRRITATLSGSPRHDASSGCGWRRQPPDIKDTRE